MQVEQEEQLRNLYTQGQVNGVELELVPIEEARKKEPTITGQDGSICLWSPNTSVVDIHSCLRQLSKEIKDKNPNFEIQFGEQFKEWE